MKILGLSFGRKGGNCDIVLKQALLGAMADRNAEVSYINTCHLKIDRCTGCGACDRVREKGGMSICVIKDDFQFVENALMEADAVIAAAPVYVLGPTGQYKNFCDRIGPSHDQSFLAEENKRRLELGWEMEKLIPEKYFKQRPMALISVGGARTRGWTSMGLAGMYLLGFPLHMKPVDALNVYGMGDRVCPVLDDELMQRLKKMGKNIAQAASMKPEQMVWKGDSEGICPVCHCDQLTVREGTTVECSVCGSIGTLFVEHGKIHVEYSAAEVQRSRYLPGGDMEHCLEIKEMGASAGAIFAQNKDRIEAYMKELEIVPELRK